MGFDQNAPVVDQGGICSDAVDDTRPRRGNVFTGFSQIVTAVVGAGILALPSALAALGWVAGILLLGALFFFIPGGAQDPTTTRPPPPPPTVIFAIITYYTTILLIDCYEYKGVRHKTYYAAVCHLLPGTPWPILMQVLQQANLVLTALGYAITAATALQKIASMLAPPDTNPHAFYLQTWFWVFMFSMLELVICQIPSLEDLGWVSIVSTIMAFVYAAIAMYYGILYWGTSPGTVGGASMSPVDKMWAIFNALGTIAFAYSFSFLTIEITDTLRHPSEETMHKSLTAAVPTMTVLFLLVAVPNYAAMGNTVNGYLFNSYNTPSWPIIVANFCVVVHLAGAYAVFSAPFFNLVERGAAKVAKGHLKGHLKGPTTRLLCRALWRTLYVAIIAVLAALMPWFNDIVSLLGGVAFFPLTVGLPIAMWSVKNKPSLMVRIGLQLLSVTCLLISIVAVVGSIQGIIANSVNYSFGM